MIRILDVFLSAFGIIIGFPLFLLIFLAGWIDLRSPFFIQERVGLNQKPFMLIKYRTMRLDTESVATHLVDKSAVTSFGSFLRKTKLDEFPQLWNVLKGDMSLVGPRPCLYSQKELINERLLYGVFEVKPGITGISQIKGVDMSNPKLLTRLDAKMVISFSIKTYFYCIFATLFGIRVQVKNL
jgi:O-antigen biosynthesis protein WbqP